MCHSSPLFHNFTLTFFIASDLFFRVCGIFINSDLEESHVHKRSVRSLIDIDRKLERLLSGSYF